jgi:hypothetical protein
MLFLKYLLLCSFGVFIILKLGLKMCSEMCSSIVVTNHSVNVIYLFIILFFELRCIDVGLLLFDMSNCHFSAAMDEIIIIKHTTNNIMNISNLYSDILVLTPRRFLRLTLFLVKNGPLQHLRRYPFFTIIIIKRTHTLQTSTSAELNQWHMASTYKQNGRFD